ncbi:unnamed protein product [Trichobilharzia szidati]|nr:unnamed protein product [Trichobilharzia szidati]
MAYREELHSSSEDDSSSDTDEDEICWKRRKSDSRPSPMEKDNNDENTPNKPGKKRPLWLNFANEMLLKDALTSTHLFEKLDSGRGVESYLVKEDSSDEGSPDKLLSRRKLPIRGSTKPTVLSLRQQLGPLSWDQSVGRSHIDVTFDSPPDRVAETIIRLLKEPNEDLIRRTVDILGVQRALEFYYLTEDVENSGGLYLMDGSRRRSPGGVYLNLIKHSYSVKEEEKKIIFLIDKQIRDKMKRIRKRHRRKRRQLEKLKNLPRIRDNKPIKPFHETNFPSPIDADNLEEPFILEDEPESPVTTKMDTTTPPGSPCRKSPDCNESLEEGELPSSDDDT